MVVASLLFLVMLIIAIRRKKKIKFKGAYNYTFAEYSLFLSPSSVYVLYVCPLQGHVHHLRKETLYTEVTFTYYKLFLFTYCS